jgi:biopolymer transport protein ExbD
MALRSRNKVDVSYSVAGMTDIIFLLLLFFMLTSTMVAPNAIKLLLPQSNTQTDARAITTVSITADIRFYIESTPALQAKMKGEKEPTIALHADKSVAVEHIVTVMNIARRNSYKVILATSPEK